MSEFYRLAAPLLRVIIIRNCKKLSFEFFCIGSRFGIVAEDESNDLA